MADKWSKYVNKEVPFVILDNTVYEVGVGQNRFDWLSIKGSQVHEGCRTRLIGKVPKKYSEVLKNTGIKVRRLSFNLS